MAKSERFNRILLYTVALLGLAADQASKYGVFHWLYGAPGNRYVLFRTVPEPADEIRGFALEVQFERDNSPEQAVLHYPNGSPVPHVNHGALFGFLRDHKTLANGAFACVSFAAAAAIIWWSTQRATANDRWLCVALGFILAGTLGNLYDRILFNGVRDFLHWDYLYNWPVFNVADSCLVCGAGLLLLQAFAWQPAKRPVNSSSDSASATFAPRSDTALAGAVKVGPG